MKNVTTHQMAANFNTTVAEIISKNQTSDKNIINNFKTGDIVACFAGFPHSVLCIVELIKDSPDVDNFNHYISGKSYLPLTSHLISGNWFKIN